MICYTPCIATSVGESSLIVGKTGWIVPPTSPEELATALQLAHDEWLSNPVRWSTDKIVVETIS